MTTAHEESESFQVGERVKLQIGRHLLTGVVLEDRGPIGVHGRRLFRIQVETSPDEVQVIEMPAEEIERMSTQQSSEPLTKPEIANYLEQGGLVAILRANMSGGRDQPRVWLCRNSIGKVTHTFERQRGDVGGETPPALALYGEKLFTPKIEEVEGFLKSFGLSADESSRVIREVGSGP